MTLPPGAPGLPQQPGDGRQAAGAVGAESLRCQGLDRLCRGRSSSRAVVRSWKCERSELITMAALRAARISFATEGEGDDCGDEAGGDARRVEREMLEHGRGEACGISHADSSPAPTRRSSVSPLTAATPTTYRPRIARSCSAPWRQSRAWAPWATLASSTPGARAITRSRFCAAANKPVMIHP